MFSAYRNFLFLLIISLINASASIAYAAHSKNAAFQAYEKGDYSTAATLLHNEIEELSKQSLAEKQSAERELIQKQLFLAHIYTWKLNSPDKALRIYRKMIAFKKQDSHTKYMQVPVLILVGNLYERKKDFLKAKEFFHRALESLAAQIEAENGSEERMMFDELNNFIKFKIDSLNLSTGPAGYQPLLSEMKLSRLASPLNLWTYTLLASAIIPTMKMDMTSSLSCEGDLAARIAQSPQYFPDMLTNYLAVFNKSSGEVDSSGESAFRAYNARYPDSYFSLSLQAMFHKYFLESGQEKKASQIRENLNALAKKRGMKMVVQDPRFSSPEKTWEVYRQALMAGDIELAMECHLPGEVRYRRVFNSLSRDRLREIAESMKSVHKVSESKTWAEYMIIKEVAGKELSYCLYFANLNGEWKIDRY